jgi:hypothetical protein
MMSVEVFQKSLEGYMSESTRKSVTITPKNYPREIREKVMGPKYPLN